jgi:nudix-type nucleoside diphosphatase (YffH/AdpP family)
MDDVSDRVRIHGTETLSARKYTLKAYDFAWRRGDGTWQRMNREVYEKGDAAAILLYNRAQRTVVLVRQFRMPAFLGGYRHGLIEACAGMLDGEAPDVRIREEAEEETGHRVHDVQELFSAFMSPGALMEKITFFAAEYDATSRAGAGGGLQDEGEDIEVLELPFDDAVAMMADGRICDAKTIMLLQWAQLNLFASPHPFALEAQTTSPRGGGES